MKRSLYALARAACQHLPVTGAILAENQALQAALAASAGVQAGLLADAGRHRQHAAALPPDFDIIIPVCNAAAWLNVIADAYDALRIVPLYIVDERSADASLNILERRKARILRATGAKPHAESMLIAVLPALTARWVLRLDDDEFPAAGLLDFIRHGLSGIQASMVGMPRHWVMQNGTEWRRTRAIEGKGYFGADYQYRLFQPAKVQVVPHLHSPGYLVKHAVAAPPAAALYHFDWVIRPYAVRAAKVALYEAQQKGGGAPYYLPEDQKEGFFDMEPLNDPALAALGARLLTTRS